MADQPVGIPQLASTTGSAASREVHAGDKRLTWLAVQLDMHVL